MPPVTHHFKAGDSVTCVNKGTNNYLTQGKVYTVIATAGTRDLMIKICNDVGGFTTYYAFRFSPLMEEDV